MKALALKEPGKVSFIDKELPNPRRGEVIVRIKAAALNHRDKWIRENKYPGIKMGVTLGSDGSGIVEEAIDGEGKKWIGKEVVINPGSNWGDNPAAQSRDFQILGMPNDGTFAEYIKVPLDRIHEKPFHLNFSQAAALPLGGLTAFRALFTNGGLKPGDKVLVNGIGGGVAQFAFLFARATGAEVWVTSSQQEKIDHVVMLGARGGFNYKEKDWPAKAKEATDGGFHLVIDSAGGDQMNLLINSMRPAGKLVFYGATTGVPSSLDLRKIFWNQLSLQGSTMGNDHEFKEMLNFVEKHKLEPIMETPIPFGQIMEGFDKMQSGRQFGKIVVEMD